MDLFEVLAGISDWLFANASKTYILLHSALASVLSLPASFGLFFKSCIRSEAFLYSCTRILSHRKYRVK